ncbi:(d)CMP kinase [Pseudofulvibacter geojedonensis]|uniref:Cytidylate kinase n=1 Tax=Pseudofulvibacter geojedonensis TaxID=1123758 RepID=A0ABW3HY39_9FLAO
MSKIIIAIDGYSSTGKSTLAKQLAKKLGFIYVDTGAMYRAVTLYAIRNGYISDENFDVENFVLELDKIKISFLFNPQLGFAEVYLNGENVEKHIRTMQVSGFVSPIAAVPEVRYLLVKQQQEMGKNKGLVMDGRDIGTVVFPNAELKLFMTASDQVRAQRRYDELIARGEQVTFDEVLHNVRERDYIDSHRENSPLMKADDAIEIDNSNLSIDEQFEKIKKMIEEMS